MILSLQIQLFLPFFKKLLSELQKVGDASVSAVLPHRWAESLLLETEAATVAVSLADLCRASGRLLPTVGEEIRTIKEASSYFWFEMGNKTSLF